MRTYSSAKFLGNCLKVIKSIDLFCNLSLLLFSKFLVVKLLLDRRSDLFYSSLTIFVHATYSSDDEVVVVHCNDVGNLAGLVLECPA